VGLIDFLTSHGELTFIICQVLLGALILYLSTKFGSKKEVAEAREMARTAHERLNILDERLKGFPDYDVVNEIKEDIGEVKEKQAEGTTELRLLREQLGRMDDFLRSKP
jgi:hypothetical protein